MSCKYRDAGMRFADNRPMKRRMYWRKRVSPQSVVSIFDQEVADIERKIYWKNRRVKARFA